MSSRVHATVSAPEEGALDLNKYLSIAMGAEAFGIPVLRVKEIIEFAPITPVPMMPAFIRGSINLRGRGVPVMDLAVRFGRAETDIGRRTCIVIVEARPSGGTRFDVGLLVDAVNAVTDIDPVAIEPTPSFGGKIRTDFMAGMAKVERGFIIMLDVDRILSMDDLYQLTEAVRANA